MVRDDRLRIRNKGQGVGGKGCGMKRGEEGEMRCEGGGMREEW